MALFNYATKEITLKIVYYGPGLSGKTTNLQYLHSTFAAKAKGKLLSLSTESDRTLFFDFFPIELGKIRDFSIRFQLYTVPGQVRYNATRKIVLKGADAVIFVADSQVEMREQNLESFENMIENLLSNNINPDNIPIALQYNKRDLQDILPIDQLNSDLNADSRYHFLEASAITGEGVEDMYKMITKLLLKNISTKHNIDIQPPSEEAKKTGEPEIPEQARVATASSVFETPKVASSFQERVPEYKTEDPVPGLKDRPELKEERTIVKKVPALPVEQLNRISGELAKIMEVLSFLKNSAAIADKDIQEIKELRKEQREATAALKHIDSTLRNIKSRKRWFHF